MEKWQTPLPPAGRPGRSEAARRRQDSGLPEDEKLGIDLVKLRLGGQSRRRTWTVILSGPPRSLANAIRARQASAGCVRATISSSS